MRIPAIVIRETEQMRRVRSGRLQAGAAPIAERIRDVVSRRGERPECRVDPRDAVQAAG